MPLFALLLSLEPVEVTILALFALLVLGDRDHIHYATVDYSH